MDRKSIKSVGAGGSGGRRSSSALGPVNSQSLGSNYTSATSGMNNNLTIFLFERGPGPKKNSSNQMTIFF